VPESHAESRYQLSLANRILANENILDAFGHVSVRHPEDPNRYLLSRSRAPQLVEASDILEFTLDSKAVHPPSVPLYSERVVHGEIYRARPDVMAICHHHCPAIMPFCIAGEQFVPVFHLGAAVGSKVPFWDSRDEFGDTNLLVVKPEEGASLARALGPHVMVLLRRHGATLVGDNLQQLVFRSIYSCRNAEHQLAAKTVGHVSPLTAGEAQLAGALYLQSNVTSRTWEYWVARLQRGGGMPPR
jgi:ribulose-5-phosphate 4-epimerase/fuculose-1-phosphate aldolase